MTSIARAIGSYFFSVSVIPSAVLTFGIWLIVHAGAFERSGPSIDTVRRSLSSVSAAQILVTSFAAFLVALISHPFQIRLVKLFEGYPAGPLLQPFFDYGLARHSRRFIRLDQQIDSIRVLNDTRSRLAAGEPPNTRPMPYERHPDVARLLQRLDTMSANDLLDPLYKMRDTFPEETRLMATRLGNEIRSGEDEAGDRYGMLGVAVSAHLALVGPKASSVLSAIAVTMERQIRLAVSFFVLAAVCLVAFANDGPWLFTSPLVALGGLVSYEGAVRAGDRYGEQTIVIADLHRRDLLKAMSYPEPRDLEDERALLGILSRQIEGEQSSEERAELNKRLMVDFLKGRTSK